MVTAPPIESYAGAIVARDDIARSRLSPANDIAGGYYTLNSSSCISQVSCACDVGSDEVAPNEVRGTKALEEDTVREVARDEVTFTRACPADAVATSPRKQNA